MADDLKPCPFCGNDGSGPVEDALHITYFEADWRSESWSVQCDKCTATMGYFDSEDEAIAAWNSRATPTVQEAAKVLLAGLGDFERDRSHPSFEAAFRGYADSNKPAPFNRIGDGLIAALRAIAGEIHD